MSNVYAYNPSKGHGPRPTPTHHPDLTKAQRLVAAVDATARLWQIHLPAPAAPMPTEAQLLQWIRCFGDEHLEHAFRRTAAKFFRPGVAPVDTCTIHRYITGCLLHMRQEARDEAQYETASIAAGA